MVLCVAHINNFSQIFESYNSHLWVAYIPRIKYPPHHMCLWVNAIHFIHKYLLMSLAYSVRLYDVLLGIKRNKNAMDQNESLRRPYQLHDTHIFSRSASLYLWLFLWSIKLGDSNWTPKARHINEKKPMNFVVATHTHTHQIKYVQAVRSI